jgi:hypothetical protein
MPDVTSTFFGLTIAFLAPGMVGLFSLKYWLASANRIFDTVLAGKANAGLFLFLLVGALALGVVVSAIRWAVYEVAAERHPKLRNWFGEAPAAQDRVGRWTPERLAAFRAAVDETYRYHQAYGGLTITLPSLFVGWLHTHREAPGAQTTLWIVFVALEVLLIAGSFNAKSRYYRNAKAIFSDPKLSS